MTHARGPVVALIPARSGSKTIPHKNLRSIGGKPLLGIAVEQARAAATVDRVIVSTDDEEYAAVARQFGAETPFLRPAEYAHDLADDLGVFRHALDWLATHEDFRPDLLVHVRPTHPRRSPADIDAVVRLLHEHPSWDSVRSVVPAPATPYKMWHRTTDGTLTPVVACSVPDAHSQPRQLLPEAFLQNACVDAIRRDTILDLRSMTGRVVGSYLMDHFGDIDDARELASEDAPSCTGSGEGSRTFCVDIDGVVATLVANNAYDRARPMTDAIAAVNALKRAGHRVVFHTARGSATGIAWEERTRAQLLSWGLEFDDLRVGKPAADFYVDDRALTPAQFLQLASSLAPQSPRPGS